MSKTTQEQSQLLSQLRDLIIRYRTPEAAVEVLFKQSSAKPLSHASVFLRAYRQALQSDEGQRMCSSDLKMAAVRDLLYKDLLPPSP